MNRFNRAISFSARVRLSHSTCIRVIHFISLAPRKRVQLKCFYRSFLGSAFFLFRSSIKNSPREMFYQTFSSKNESWPGLRLIDVTRDSKPDRFRAHWQRLSLFDQRSELCNFSSFISIHSSANARPAGTDSDSRWNFSSSHLELRQMNQMMGTERNYFHWNSLSKQKPLPFYDWSCMGCGGWWWWRWVKVEKLKVFENFLWETQSGTPAASQITIGRRKKSHLWVMYWDQINRFDG